METIIITGGSGFIGSHFTRLALTETDKFIVVIDKLTYAGNLENLQDVLQDHRFQFHQGDITDRNFINELLNKYNPTAIVNFAAETHVDRSIDNADVFMQTNIIGVYELLEAVRHYLLKKDCCDKELKLLHVSTDEVYGSLGKNGKFEEISPYRPSSPYSASKAAADHLISAYHKTYGLNVLITNSSNNYGPYQFPEKLIPLMILNAYEGKPLPIYGDGKHSRDWLFVEDNCRGILKVLEHGQAGEQYNIGSEVELNNKQVVERICDIIDKEYLNIIDGNGKRVKQSCKNQIIFVEDRPGHDERYALDTSKIRHQLGWKPYCDFDSGIRKTISWYIENGEWCANVKKNFDRKRIGLPLDTLKNCI